MYLFLKRNLAEIKVNPKVFLKKIFKLILLARLLPIYVIASLFVILIRVVKPYLLIRFRGMFSARIGHFAAETEQYLCEYDSKINFPKKRHIDIFYFASKPISNTYLAKMWKRKLIIWPSFLVKPVHNLNKLLPGSSIHEIGNNTQGDRDVHNLLDKSPPHLQFTEEEEIKGKEFLESIGINKWDNFVCLNVRDSSYLQSHFKKIDFSYHNHRDSDINNYVLAAETLANKGYFVIRMGAKVHKKINSNHPKIFDYATSGSRTEFLDLYLAAKCSFCISTGSGFDNVVGIMRRPTVFVNILPVGYSTLFSERYILIPKHHYSLKKQRNLNMSEIFKEGVGYCMTSSEYKKKHIKVIENSPDEINEASIEMIMRLENTWKDRPIDILNQKKFRAAFPSNAVDPVKKKPLHGEIRSKISSYFLRKNPEWLN